MSRIYQEYPYHSAGNTGGKVKDQLVKKVLKEIKNLSGIQSICELGCGNGYLAHLLAKGGGYRISAVDASESGIQIARENYGERIQFIRAIIDKDLAERTGLGEFDMVLACEVIEHLYRLADLLEAAWNLLKPGGYLLLSTPYHGYLKNLAIALTGKGDTHWNPLWDCGHIKFFSRRTLTILLQQHGFKIIRWSFYGRAPGLWKGMICLANRG